MQNINIPSIETDRLLLVSMSAPFLQAMLAKNYETAAQLGDFAVPSDCPVSKYGARRRLELIKQDPAQHPWMERAIVLKTDKRMIGHINFHHKAPDPDLSAYADMAVELGYTIAPDYRRKGYGKESAIAMMEWAYHKHDVRSFFLSIRPNNIPSMRLAESMNFTKVGEWQDPIDGLEYVMRAEIEAVLEAKENSRR